MPPDQSPFSQPDREQDLRISQAALQATLAAETDAVHGATDPVGERIRQAAGRVLADLRDAHADEPPPEVIARTLDALSSAALGVGSEAPRAGTLVHAPAESPAGLLVGEFFRRLVDAGRSLVATLTFDTRADLGLAGFRSGSASDEVHLAFECEFARIDVLALREDEGASWRLRGQITSEGFEPSAVAITPRDPGRAQEPLVLTALDSGGFERIVPSGAYTLAIEFDDGVKLVLASLDLAEPANGPTGETYANDG